MYNDVIIGCDHAGYKYKEVLKKLLEEKEVHIEDIGVFSEEPTDYPKIAYFLTEKIKQQQFGILICGSGIGMAIAANRSAKARAALCTTTQHAQLARQHNDANILVLGSRLTNKEEILKIVEVFFTTKFEEGRHRKRVDMLSLQGKEIK